MSIYQRIQTAVRLARMGFKQDPRAAAAIGAFFSRSGAAYSGSARLDYRAASQDGYKRLTWVFRCIKALGEAAGSVPWHSYVRESDGTIKPLDDSYPLTRLIEQPNPRESRKEFLDKWMIHLSLSGNDYWEIVFVKNVPYQLYSIRPDWMTPIPDKLVYLKGYDLDTKSSGKPIHFDPQEILHFKYIDPTNEYVGMSPLQAAASTMQTENSAIGWNQTIFDNSAVPSGVLTVPSQLLRAEGRDDLRKSLRSEFTRENLNSPMILWGGMTWEKMGLSQRDMDFLEQRRTNRYEICGALGVPPELIGAAQERLTYNNYETARLSFWEDTVIGILDWLKGKINQRLAPFFGDNVFINYDLRSVPAMRKSFADTISAAEKLVKMGVPFNEVNRRLNMGFNDLPWGDVWWAAANLMPIDGPPVEASGEGAEEDINPFNLERMR